MHSSDALEMAVCTLRRVKVRAVICNIQNELISEIRDEIDDAFEQIEQRLGGE